MTTARDIMTADPTTIGETDSLIDAARIMRDLNVGALPICGEDGRLKGVAMIVAHNELHWRTNGRRIPNRFVAEIQVHEHEMNP